MSETMILSRDAILAADDLPRETVEVPEWGGAVIVQGLTSRQRDLFEASIQKRRPGGKKRHKDQQETEDRIDLDNFRAKLVVRCVVDEQGSRIFGDQDIETLGAKSAQAVSRLFDVAQRLCGMSNEDVEELAGNSGETTGGGSSSA